MNLSNDLISEFVKVTRDEPTEKVETTVYGTIVVQDGKDYVRLDGSDLITPIIKTVDVENGERVKVEVKNHTATVIGNVSSPAARTDDVQEMGGKVDDAVDQITEFEIVIADKVDTKDFTAQVGRIDDLVTDNVVIKEQLIANKADIDEIVSDNVIINEKLTATEAEIEELNTTKLDAKIADLTYATIESLDATNANIYNLEATYGEFEDLTTNKFVAYDGAIRNLETNKLSATEAALKYANIDFSNIKEAAIEKIFSDSGIIKDLIVSDGKITGELVGVTIKGDIIEGGTVIADKLVIKGSDGLFYKLNTDGATTTAEQTEYNSLNGRVIIAKSVTAEKIAVDDLVAFDATIGGFNITNNAIYSGVKNSISNTTTGIYLDREGQISIGDINNFFKYYKDQNGKFKLEISAQSIKLGSSNTSVENALNNAIVSTIEQFYQSTSATSLVGGTWSVNQPAWTEGTYIWRRTLITYGDLRTEYTPSENGVCITGNTGPQGEQGLQGTPGPTGPTGEDGQNGVSLSNGKILYPDIIFAEGDNGCTVYNESANDNVTITRQANSDDNPYTNAEFELMVQTVGLASPNWGGIIQDIPSRANAVFVRRVIAKIPIGRQLNNSENSMGADYSCKWLTPKDGTGKFTEYMYMYTCGATGDFLSGGHMYISGGTTPTSSSPLTWYIASCETFDITTVPINSEDLATKDELNSEAAELDNAITEAQSAIDILTDQISSLVVDENGSSLMTQTPDGWRFDMSSITGNMDAIKKELDDVSDTNDATEKLVTDIQSTVDKINNKTAYIDIKDDAAGKPVMTLGSSESSFKVVITNESIDFMEGSNKVAYASNNRFYAPQMVTVNSVQIGENPGFRWEIRESGNLGLTYIS